MSSSVLDLVGKFNKAGEFEVTGTREGVKGATAAAKVTLTKAAEAVNTPKKLRGRKSSNAWRVRSLLYTSEPAPRSVVFYSGAPPYWRERGTEGHDIAPRKGHSALLINGLFATGAHVKGLSARPFWTPTKEAVKRESMPIIKTTQTAALVRAGFR